MPTNLLVLLPILTLLACGTSVLPAADPTSSTATATSAATTMTSTVAATTTSSDPTTTTVTTAMSTSDPTTASVTSGTTTVATSTSATTAAPQDAGEDPNDPPVRSDATSWSCLGGNCALDHDPVCRTHLPDGGLIWGSSSGGCDLLGTYHFPFMCQPDGTERALCQAEMLWQLGPDHCYYDSNGGGHYECQNTWLACTPDAGC